MEECFQEAGRAGRCGLPAKVHIFFNSHDMSKGSKQLSDVMRNYVKEKKCKREMILNSFEFKAPSRGGSLHECCDFHQNMYCDCDDCVISSIPSILEEAGVQDDETTSATTQP